MTRRKNTHQNYPEILSELMEFLGDFLVARGVDAQTAAAASFSSAEMLREKWGGQAVYIGKGASFNVSERNSKIYFDEYRGDNVDELAKKYELTTVRIYQIIAEMKKIDAASRQPTLPGMP